MISEEFAIRVARISTDREALLKLMAELDEEKRQIRSFQRKFSNYPKDDGGLAGSDRYKKLRRMKDRYSFLVEEREYVRQAIGRLKADQKAANRARSGRSLAFCQAFYAAAERELDDSLLLDLEARAAQIIEAHQEGSR